MSNLRIIKRNGEAVDFDGSKIVVAIEKAMDSPTGYFVENQADMVAKEIEDEILHHDLPSTVLQVEKRVFEKLIEKNNIATAKAYESYRSVQSFKRENNSTDSSIESLLTYSDADLMDENSNKNAVVVSPNGILSPGKSPKTSLAAASCPRTSSPPTTPAPFTSTTWTTTFSPCSTAV